MTATTPPLPQRPHASQPGTLREQLDAVDLYWSDPTRRTDPTGAWMIARRLAMPHARRRDR